MYTRQHHVIYHVLSGHKPFSFYLSLFLVFGPDPNIVMADWVFMYYQDSGGGGGGGVVRRGFYMHDSCSEPKGRLKWPPLLIGADTAL